MDRVMVEMMNRERRERITMWEYTTTAIGIFQGVSKPNLVAVINPLKKDLENELFQKDFAIDKVRRRIEQRRDETRETRLKIERLDDMSTTKPR